MIDIGQEMKIKEIKEHKDAHEFIMKALTAHQKVLLEQLSDTREIYSFIKTLDKRLEILENANETNKSI